jgi:hypothetical protein
MRKFLLPLLAATCLLFQGCLKDKLTQTYSILTPVYKEKTEVYASIKSSAAKSITSPGKIYVYGNYIFLNEVDKGVHVIDNSNPSSPQVKAFIDIPGNLDIAIKGNTLYADLYRDLVVVDIANPLQARFVKYLPEIFPARSYNGFIADSNRVIVDWIRRDTTMNLNDYYTGPGYYNCNACSVITPIQFGSGGRPLPAALPTTGIAGSMARFSLVNDYLYTVNHANLTAFYVASTESPVRSSNQNVGWNIETIYPFNNKLFIGSTTGMFIYDISNPANPVKQSQVNHIRACDPVIADNNFAYVTLSSGTNSICGSTVNVFNVYDISNLAAPVLSCTKNMTSPHGLAKAGNLIFICDGNDGLKIYDATNSACNMQLVKHFTGMETYDAIAWNSNLLVVAKDGLYQYDYSNPTDIKQRSKLVVNR